MALMNKNTGANRKQDILQNRTACTKALWQKQGSGVQGPFTGIGCLGPFHEYQVFRALSQGSSVQGPFYRPIWLQWKAHTFLGGLLTSCSPERKNQEIVKDNNTNL